MVAPGCFSSMELATRAVVSEPETGSACLVDEEHPVGVTVEGEPDVGAVLEHRRLQVDQVLGLDGVGRMVGEGAVELAEEDRDLEGQRSNTSGHHQPAHAVGGVGHHPERAQRADVDERADVVRVLLEQVRVVERRPSARRPAGARGTRSARPGSRPARCPGRSGRAPARQSLMPL